MGWQDINILLCAFVLFALLGVKPPIHQSELRTHTK